MSVIVMKYHRGAHTTRGGAERGTQETKLKGPGWMAKVGSLTLVQIDHLNQEARVAQDTERTFAVDQS